MTIWLISLLVGAATFGMRLAFLVRARRAQRSFSSPRWLRFVPPAILAALVVPALLPARQVIGAPLTAETLHQVLAAGLAAIVAWRFQNVLLTVASGMGALWGLLWLAPVTSFALPLGVLLVTGVGLVLLANRLLVRLRRQQDRSGANSPVIAQPAMPVLAAERERPLALAEPKGR